MRLPNDRKSGAAGFAQQNLSTGGIDRVEVIRSSGRIARQAANGVLIIFVDCRTVVRGSVVEEIMVIHHIQQINVTVLTKVWVQGQAEHAMIMVGSDFFADVQNRSGKFDVI